MTPLLATIILAFIPGPAGFPGEPDWVYVYIDKEYTQYYLRHISRAGDVVSVDEMEFYHSAPYVYIATVGRTKINFYCSLGYFELPGLEKLKTQVGTPVFHLSEYACSVTSKRNPGAK